MPKKGYRQTEEHKSKHLEKIRGEGNGKYKDGKWAKNPSKWHSEFRRVWREANPLEAAQRARRSHLVQKYGITLEEYESMLHLQNGKCFICDKIPKNKLSIDHNHLDGSVRGLLCTSCNFGLGNFKDSIELLKRAIDYLKK